MICFFTDKEVERDNSGSATDLIRYKLDLGNNKSVYLKFSERSEDWVDDPETLDSMEGIDAMDASKLIPLAIADIKHILKSLVLNGKWSTEYYNYLVKKNLYSLLNRYDYPKTVDEKVNNLITHLHNLQTYEGEFIELRYLYQEEWKKLFFRNEEEFHFYLQCLGNSNIIDLNNQTSDGMYCDYNFTYTGLNYISKLKDEGKHSNNCFVAMSFDKEDLENIYDKGIVPVLNELNINPLIVITANYESDKTINDAMIALIKKSKFIIADFSKQKRNVYFEAGFAAGLGLKVIYSCHVDYFDSKTEEIKKSAFDTNHFPHIIWKDIEDFKIQLKNRIEAYIL